MHATCGTEVTLHKLAGPAVRGPVERGMVGCDPPSIPVADMAGEEQEASAGPVWPWADCRKLGEWELRGCPSSSSAKSHLL